MRLVAELKTRACEDNRIEVYFEDNPGIVDLMRKLSEEHGTGLKVLKYGPWIS